MLVVLNIWSTAIAVVGQQPPIHEIYRLSEIYHKDLFQPHTWVFLDIDETLIARNQPLDPDFVNTVKNYSDLDSVQNPAATKFFILTAQDDLNYAKDGIRQAGLDPDKNISGFLLSPGDSNKGEKLKEFLREQFQAGNKPKHIVFSDALLPQLVSVQKAFQEMQKSEPDVVNGVQLHLFHINARTPKKYVKQAAGVFLYMRCPSPNRSGKYCAVLIDRNYGQNKDTFSNPGGLVDPGESPAHAAAREATEELGGHMMLSEQSLHTDYRNPNTLLKLVDKNVSDADFDTVEYHMYFKEIPTESASDILKSIKEYTGHGANESNAVAIVPLSDLSRLEQQMTIQTNAGQTYAHKNGAQAETVEIKLYPQMLQLLNQSITTKNGTITWYELFINHLDRRINLMTDKQELQFAQTIARKAQLAGEIKAKQRELKSRHGIIKERAAILSRHSTPSEQYLAALPYTASDAYLQLMMGEDYDRLKDDPKALIDTFFDHPYTKFGKQAYFNKPEFREAIVKALQQERTKKSWYVFYHGTDAKLAFLYDVLSTYRARFKARHAQASPNLRFLDQPFIGLENVSEFKEFFEGSNNFEGGIDDYVKDFENSNFKEGTLGKRNYQDMGLSVNASIFGSDNVPGDSSINFFAQKTTNTPPNYKALFNAVRTELGFDKTWEDFDPLFEEYQRNYGRLYQIFINSDHIDQISHLSDKKGNSVLLDFKDQGKSDVLSKAIPLLRKNPSDFQKIVKDISSVQARLFLKPEVLNDPNLAQIRIYDNKPKNPQQDQAFWAKLNAMVDEDVAQWILKKERMSDGVLQGGEQPVERLAKEIYKGEAGLPYQQKDPIQRKMLELKQLLDTGDVQGVQNFIKANPTYPIDLHIENIDYYNSNKSFKLPPLLYVYDKVTSNKQDLIKSLIQVRANINETDDFQKTLFTRVIRDKDQDFINMLLANESLDLKHVDQFGRTYLHVAVQAGNLGLVQRLIEKGLDVNATYNKGMTPFSYAIMSRNKEVIETLLANESLDLKHVDQLGQTYLHTAVRAVNPELVQSLIERGLDVNAQEQQTGDTPVHIAVMQSKIDLNIVNLLQQHRAALNIKNKDGKYPLQLLLEKGVLAGLPGYQNVMGHSLKIDLTQYTPDRVRSFLYELGLRQTITHISFEGGTLNDILQVLEMVKNLQGLSVPKYNLGIQGLFDIVNRCPNLKSLDASENNLGDDGMLIIAQTLQNLVELNAARNKVTHMGTQALSTMQRLTSLNLEQNSIGAEGATAIARSPHMANLTSLNLNANHIGAEGATAIARSPHMANLTSLNLEYNQIGAEGATAIAQHLNNLTSLALGVNNIGDAGATAIAQHLSKLTSLNLNANHIGAEGATAIAQRLINLTSLDLYDNNIRAEGATAIAQHLSNLTSLNLVHNNIGAEGATAIAEGLINLTSLDLYLNNISDAGATAIAQHLSNLTSLNLDLNNIGDAGATAIAGSPHMANLTSLNLYQNNIGAEVKQQLKDKFGNRVNV